MKKYFTQKRSRNKKDNLNFKKLFFALVAIVAFLTSNYTFAQTPVSSLEVHTNAVIQGTEKKPNDTIKAIDNNGVTGTKPVNVNRSPFSITCGNVYASGYSGGRNSLYELNGSTMIPVFTAPQIIGGLAISANGNAYYDDGTFTASPLYSSDSVSQTNTGAIVNSLLVGEAADADGNVYYINNVGHLRKNVFGITGESSDLGALVFDAGDTIGPTLAYGDMTFDGNGRLFWYASALVNNVLGKSYLYVIDTATLKASSLGNIGPDNATGLAFDTAGKLITTSGGGATVMSVDLSSPFLEGTVIGIAEPSVYDLGSCATPLFNPILTATKSVANITSGTNPATTAQVGDVLEYTIVVSNVGNLISNNSLFADAIPVSTTYVLNSTTINGNPIADVAGNMPFATPALINSPTELPGIINVGSTATITFRVTIDASATGMVSNTATISYPVVNDGVTTTETVDSNTVVVSIELNPILTAAKSVANITSGANPALTAQVGDVLEYTIAVSNIGNLNSNNSLFADAIPASTTYVLNSTTINSNPIADVAGNMPFATPTLINSPTELPGIIIVGSTATITFRVTIDANAAGTVSNTATVSYPTTNGGVTTTETVDSNTVIVSIEVFNPILTAAKSVANITSGANPATTAQVGDVLEYTIEVSNIGNLNSNNSLFADAIPASTTYVLNSTTINGNPIADVAGNMPFATPALINSPTELPGIIIVGSTATITFRVTIDATATGMVSNTATVTYPTTNDGVTTTETADSNTVIVSIEVFNPILTAAKSVANITSGANPALTAQVGDVLEYTIVVSNIGNLNSNNTLFADAIPVSTTYVPNSTTINGNSIADVAGNMPFATPALINSPMELPGIIIVGSTATITFRVTIDANAAGTVSNTATVTYPVVNGGVTTTETVDSNTVIVSIEFNPILTATKSVANITTGANPALTAQVGNVLEYTITVSNIGNLNSNNTLFADAIPVSTTYVPNSTMINGNPIADVAGNMPFATPALINSPTELPGIIIVGSTATITFRVTIDANATGTVSNTATVTYPVVNGGVTTTETTDSNMVIVSIELNPILTAVKSVANITTGVNPALTAQIGDVLEYTIEVSNTGNLNSNNSLFADAIPVSTTYVPNSTMINGNPIADVAGNMPFATPALINSPTELPGTIIVGSTATISFRVTIDAGTIGTVSNTATISYPVVNDGVTTTETTDSNTVIVSVPVGITGVEIHDYLSLNGDGANEIFIIEGINNYPDNTVEIYNRWGVLVYDVFGYNNADKSFNGISNGRVTVNKEEYLPAGTYYYVLRYKNQIGVTEEKVGYLYISR